MPPYPESHAMPAATLLLLRDGPFEVLMVRRSRALEFGADHWVFPGGRVDAADEAAAATSAVVAGLADGASRIAALRELAEEAGLELPPDVAATLVPLARWMPPQRIQRRFDTLFYLGAAPAGCAPQPDGEEAVEARFWSPQAAMAAAHRGEMALMPPTYLSLHWLATAGSSTLALAAAAAREVPLITSEFFHRDERRYIRVSDNADLGGTEFLLPPRAN